MPDLTEQGELFFWPEELCSSCREINGCALIKALQKVGIVFFNGCRVWKCKAYYGDVASPFFLSPEERYPLETARENLRAVVEGFTQVLED